MYESMSRMDVADELDREATVLRDEAVRLSYNWPNEWEASNSRSARIESMISLATFLRREASALRSR